ncbi:hypothetical protein DBR06_SOUSAS2310055 [Sousa chinensis]|nr:hypothetical protein DBR06_SOUSAS2310055 [Sousa chinensis]
MGCKCHSPKPGFPDPRGRAGCGSPAGAERPAEPEEVEERPTQLQWGIPIPSSCSPSFAPNPTSETSCPPPPPKKKSLQGSVCREPGLFLEREKSYRGMGESNFFGVRHRNSGGVV